ncbi:MAG: alpha/beta fold hydrolase [Sphingomonadaceae bacterium]|nr:alpha/beta fold hydrolase [Sphingomonadaceae bacterium]
MFHDSDQHLPAHRRAAMLARGVGHSLSRRAKLLTGKAPQNAHTPPLRLLAGEASHLVTPLVRKFQPPLPIAPAPDPKVIVLMPGFATAPWRMKYMARQLERAGHKVKRWGLGANFGPTPENLQMLAQRVQAVHARYGQQLVLVGWSLGGVFAREVAKLHPECVAKVITMGTPFSHSPYSNNLWRIYQLTVGHSVEAPPVEVTMHEKPPVETVAFWSPRDGVISRRAACGRPGERDRAVALRCNHMGFCNSREVIIALDQELRRN